MNQSVLDTCASFFTLLTAVVEVDGTRMSRDSIYDQFVCRMWLTRTPLWCFLFTSTYGILLMALDRYAAVIYHTWYHTNVRIVYMFKYRWIARFSDIHNCGKTYAFVWCVMYTKSYRRMIFLQQKSCSGHKWRVLSLWDTVTVVKISCVLKVTRIFTTIDQISKYTVWIQS